MTEVLRVNPRECTTARAACYCRGGEATGQAGTAGVARQRGNWRFDVKLERVEPAGRVKKLRIVETHGKAPEQYPQWE
jgi:hypothetical protein